MRLALWAAAVLVLPLAAAQPAPRRATFTPIEKALDVRLYSAARQDPVDLLGGTRGIYLAGFGAVFTAEVSLVVTPGVNPFHQQITSAEVKAVHERKLKRLDLMRQVVRDMLITAATALDSVPPNEQVAVAVRFLYLPWEDTAGLPSQMMMRAARGSLVKKAGQDNAIQTEEY